MTSFIACGCLPSGLPAPVVDISFSGDSMAGQSSSLQCSASVVAGLVVQPDMEIVFPNMTVVAAMSISSLIYTFSPLRTSDGGQYTCTATVNIPEAGITDLKSTAIETLSVTSECAQVYMHAHLCCFSIINVHKLLHTFSQFLFPALPSLVSWYLQLISPPHTMLAQCSL